MRVFGELFAIAIGIGGLIMAVYFKSPVMKSIRRKRRIEELQRENEILDKINESGRSRIRRVK